MAGYKYVNLRKIENFVISKWYFEHISKDEGKETNFRRSLKNLMLF